MPRGSEELTIARKEEIIQACAKLYETMSFREITIKEIGKETSFTRTSIYNYFQTKEEIFLALFQREYEWWTRDLEELLRANEKLDARGFADALARTLEKRERLLKLMSMNHYDMEANSRMENLIEFKIAYKNSIGAVNRCLEKFFPEMSEEDRNDFVYGFYPFMFGIYPYTRVTEKQKAAMEQADLDYPRFTVYKLAGALVRKLLSDTGSKEE
ncbi:TetR/AcrR family transcriptional regulator [uncultured Merdimonas sp.]|uniref:TetR/AcrR family transcriptional regulator n=1 Tax=uncultured Merdimonas sp. TaxID=2023269 RepID=UPI00320B6189